MFPAKAQTLLVVEIYTTSLFVGSSNGIALLGDSFFVLFVKDFHLVVICPIFQSSLTQSMN
jgi:hypothetical protein